MPQNDAILTVKDVAAQLKVSPAWVRDHALGRRLPFLPSIRIGGKRGLLRFRQGDIDRFLRDNLRNEVA